MNQKILEKLKERFQVLQLDRDRVILNSTLYVAQYDINSELCVWRAHCDFGTWDDGLGVGELKTYDREKQQPVDYNTLLDTLEEWCKQTKAGYLRCEKCGKWILAKNEWEWRHSGFVGVVCKDCEPEPIDTSDW